jgi:hypothetical protein
MSLDLCDLRSRWYTLIPDHSQLKYARAELDAVERCLLKCIDTLDSFLDDVMEEIKIKNGESEDLLSVTIQRVDDFGRRSNMCMEPWAAREMSYVSGD